MNYCWFWFDPEGPSSICMINTNFTNTAFDFKSIQICVTMKIKRKIYKDNEKLTKNWFPLMD